jgi:hypothetical protein
MTRPRTRRILQTLVPAIIPETGPIHAVLVGEAPGPAGADQTGIPFWGDAAGKLVYRALVELDLAEVPDAAWDDWDGARFISLGLSPRLKRVGLTNALRRCPTEDGRKFRPPRKAELADAKNLARLRSELLDGAERSTGRLLVVSLGECARWTIDQLNLPPQFVRKRIGHPSRQGLLGGAAGHGKGVAIARVEDKWVAELKRLLEMPRT